MFSTNNQLAFVLAQTVNFGWSNYTPDGKPDRVVQETIAYQCACFVAQHTNLGGDGVEIVEAMNLLDVDRELSYDDRFNLALKCVEFYGGVK